MLSLGGNRIRKINGLNGMGNLLSLSLSNNEIKLIENLKPLSSLVDLDLRNNKFVFVRLSREELEPYFKELTNLKVLNFQKYPNSDSYPFYQ